MQLKIENILSIKKADITIDGLTVIAGINDSGKSTIGKALFCLVKSIAMSKSSYFEKSRENYIKYKTKDLKNLIQYITNSKEKYNEISLKIGKFEKEIKQIKESI